MLKLRTPNFLSLNARADPDHKHMFNVFKLRRMLRERGFRAPLDVSIGSRLCILRPALSYLINLLIDELVVTAVK